jgi:hypothetical protein
MRRYSMNRTVLQKINHFAPYFSTWHSASGFRGGCHTSISKSACEKQTALLINFDSKTVEKSHE